MIKRHIARSLFLFSFITTLTACTVIGPAHDTEVTPRWSKAPSEDGLAAWSIDVQTAIDEWQAVLGADCAFPIGIGLNGPAVSLVANTDWSPMRPAKAIGLYWPFGMVEIRGDSPEADDMVYALAHEFGHAVGFSDALDMKSVMYYASDGAKAPSGADGVMLRGFLGCGG